MFQVYFMAHQICFLHQMEMYDDLQDPMATYLETFFHGSQIL
jgi:hypothetical protein